MAGVDINVRGTGLFSPDGMAKYEQKIKTRIYTTYEKSVRNGAKDTKDHMRSKARSLFNVKRNTFLNTFGTKAYYAKKDKPATMLAYQKISKWFRIHEDGGLINGKMLIPFEHFNKRYSISSFKNLIKNLQQNKKSFWKRVGGNLILFAVVDRKTNSSRLRRYKDTYKKQTGAKMVKAGTALPIGILVSRIKMKRKYNFTKIVKDYAPARVMREFDGEIRL